MKRKHKKFTLYAEYYQNAYFDLLNEKNLF